MRIERKKEEYSLLYDSDANPETFPDFASVINAIVSHSENSNLSRQVFIQEPKYTGLPKTEIEAVKRVRQLVLDNRELRSSLFRTSIDHYFLDY